MTSQPTATCSTTIGSFDPVAIVTIHGQTNATLRDYADESHPQTVCTFGEGVFPLSILDPHHVVANYGPATVILELPSGRVFEIGVPGDGGVVAVASDLSQALEDSGDPPALHDIWDGGDVLIQTYPQIGGLCGGGPRPGAFSRDSQFGFAIWGQATNATYLNIVHDHKSVYVVAPPAAGWQIRQEPSMAVWSPVEDKLYFNLLGSVWAWTPAAGAVKLRPGLLWGYPAISGDGTRVAHEIFGSNSSTVHLMDPSSGADLGQIGGGQRALPMFLGKDLLWMRNSSPGCGPSEPASFVYDFRDKTESASILDWVTATWPATSALGA